MVILKHPFENLKKKLKKGKRDKFKIFMKHLVNSLISWFSN